jgi:sugar phosphate isomerase/epimerase
MWSEDEIRGRLAISTALFQKVQLSETEIGAIKRAGIDRVEISMVRKSFDDRDEAQVDRVLEACNKHDVEVVSVHGPFDLPYADKTEDGERAVIEGSVAPIGLAERAGAKHYVGHFGNDDRAHRIVETLVERTEGMSVVLTTENQTGQPLKPYDDFATGIESERAGWTLDIGHARDDDKVNPFVKSRAADTIQSQCANVNHTHLHDSFDQKSRVDHWPPMHKDGIIRWIEVFEGLQAIGYGGHFIFEDGRGEDPDVWMEHAATFPERFVERRLATENTEGHGG